MGAHGRRRLVRVLVCTLVVATSTVVSAPSVQAAPTVPFAARRTFNDNGAIALVGNNLLTCPASAAGCTAAKAASSGGSEVNNNNYVMENVDVDGDASTFNSSNSQLLLPDGSTVLWAGLYWGARVQRGDFGTTTTAPRGQMSLRGPTDTGYRTIASQVEFGPNGTDQSYQEFADVTTVAQAEGSGTWWGANVAAGTGKDRYAGWSLVVVYRNPALPLRNLTVFDGFNVISGGNPQTISISGFLAPLAGPVQTQLGMIAYEGDRGSVGDSASLTSGAKTTTLATNESPGNNFFNGSNDRNGQNVTTRNPADRNMLGYDIMDFGAPNTIPNGATSASIKLTTGGETYYPGVVTTAIDLFAPDFTPSVKTVTNLDGHSPAGPGDTLEYTVNLVNAGGDPAGNAVLTDPLPPNTTYVPGSLAVVNGPGAGPKTDAAGDDQSEFLAASRTVRFRVGTGANATAGGTIGVNAATTISFRVTLDAAAAGTTVSNQASLAYTAQTLNLPFTYVTNPAPTDVVANADLALSKTTSPDPVIAGQQATSTITVHNNGPNAAENVHVRDVLPANVTFVSATPSTGSCTQASGTVDCALGTLANGATATVTVAVQVVASSTDATLTDVASATTDTIDPNPQDNTAGSTVGVATSADLVITKTANTASVAPGQSVTFPITVQNNGPSDAQSVTVTDSFDPSEFSFGSLDRTDVCTAGSAGISCALPSLGADATFTVNLTLIVPPGFAGTSASNTATVTAATPDPNTGNDSATAAIVVSPPQADVAVTKTAEPTTVIAGERVTYTLELSNASGPSDASGVVLTDALPAGLTARSAVTDLGSCKLGPPVSCDVGTLFVGATATVTITADTSPDAPIGTVTNDASVTAASIDPDPSNNTGSATTTVTGEADLDVIKTGTPIVPGTNVTYTVTVGNAGPSTARGMTVTDALPGAFGFVSATPSQGTCAPPSGATLSCTLGDVAIGTSPTVTIVLSVPAAFTGDALDTATVASSTPDPDASDNTASFNSSTNPQADISISKSAPIVVDAGATIPYELVVANAGPSAAANVAVSDVLPAGLTFVSVTTDQGTCTGGATVTCTIGTVLSGTPVHVSIVARVDAATDSGTRVANTATVTTTTADPTDSNNGATATTTVDTAADVTVTKTLTTPSPLAPGQILDFQVEVHNNGPSVARGVSVRDSFPLVFLVNDITINGVSASPSDCVLSSSDLLCTLPDLAPGATTTVVFSLLPDPGALLGTQGVNSASAASVTPDPDTTNNAAEAPFSFDRLESDVAISKTGDAQLVAGTPFSYTLTVTDEIGPSDAQGVIVTDTVPAGLTATQALPTQGTCTIAGAVVTCDLGTVARLAPPVTISLTGTVDANAVPGAVTNTASVASSTPDPNPSQNIATFDSTIAAQADLTVSKTPNADPLVAGTAVGYTITVTNAGPSDATPVTLTDLLPAAIVFDPMSSDPSCTLTTNVTCAIGTVGAGETRVVQVAGRLDASFTGATVANTATVQSPVDDPNPGDNAATATSDVVREADLSVTKLADSTTPAAGSDVTYALTVINNGPSDAVNASFTDLLPLPPVAFVLPSQGDVTCALTGLEVRCSIALLRAGESRTGQITIHLPPTQPPGPIANAATVTSDTPDPDPTNNDANATVSAVVAADLKITKTIETNAIVAGAPVTYRLDVLNQGPSIAPNVLVSDPLSPNVTFTSASTGCVANQVEDLTTVVGCSLGALAVGATTSATITVTPLANATGTLSNTATVGSDALDSSTGDNTATANSPITTIADLAVTLTGPPTVDAGGLVTFHLGFVNNGPSDATNVVFTNTLPAGLTLPQLPPACTLTGATLTCQLASLAAGASGTVDLTVQIDPAALTGAIFTQHATITADQTDPNPANDAASLDSTVLRATDVGVTVTADEPTVPAGGIAGFTVTVTNNGPLAATDVQLVNVLPDALTSPLDPFTCTFAGNTATCALGAMPVGASTTIHFTGTVPSTTPAGTSLTDSATVSHSEPDTNAANDNANAAVTVVAAEVSAGESARSGSGSGSSDTNLPFTGGSLMLGLGIGLVALVVGAAMCRAAYLRRAFPK
jgi:uncharacterized repeat protein (TIGR01451 family)